MIMKNLRLDALRAPGPLLEPMADWDPEAPAEIAPTSITDEQRILREVIQELPEREQLILYKTIECFDHDSGEPVLSIDELHLLARTLGTTLPNIRQIRRRTYERVRQRMERRMADRVSAVKQEQGGPE